MDERKWLAQRFEGHRTRLRAMAYPILGSLSEGGRRRAGGETDGSSHMYHQVSRSGTAVPRTS
jgi:hypothetical protein